jgi:hypothetical protein
MVLGMKEGWKIAAPVFTACTGDVLGQFYNGSSSQWSQAQKAQATATPHFDVITLSFGGDDIGFKPILEACYEHLVGWELANGTTWSSAAQSGNTNGHCPTTLNTIESRINQLVQGTSSSPKGLRFGPNNSHMTLAQFYAHVANTDLTSRGELLVVGYPALFAPTGQWGSWRGGTCDFMDATDAEMLNQAAQYLDQQLSAAVIAAQSNTSRRIHYLSLEDTYGAGVDHSLCSGNTEWINGPSLDFTHSFHPNELGNLATGEYIAGELSQNFPGNAVSSPTTTTTTTSTGPATDVTTTTAAPIRDGDLYNIGDPFDAECIVAWPTAPTITDDSIVMTMSCQGVPSQFLFTQVTYNDPGLAITPDTGEVRVIGRVVNYATSEYGFRELVVRATNVVLPNTSNR